MEGNWRRTQFDASMPSSMYSGAGDWRNQLHPDSRQQIVNKIMETLKRHLPISVPEGLNELQKIAIRFEEKIYTAATSQSDYFRKISLKMLSMETKTQSAPINPAMSNAGGVNQNTNGPAHQTMLNALEPGSNIDSVSGNPFNAVQDIAIDSRRRRALQNSMSTPQQSNVNALSQSALNSLQNNAGSLQSKSNILQQQQREDSTEKRGDSCDEPSPSNICLGGSVKRREPTFSCPICFSAMVTPFTTVCGHVFCEECIKAAIKRRKDCPTCRCRLGGRNSIHRVFLPNVD